MKALVYNGPKDVSISITATNISGSDLHIYEGRNSLEEGRAIGHENLGEVIEVGDAVTKIAVGALVSVPFNIGFGATVR